MLTGFEALGAASAVLQVISFAADVAVACKNAYDGATTSHDDLQRYAGQMSEAVDRVHTRCEQMRKTNTKFASPKLQNIAKECKDATDKLEDEVKCVTSLQAKGNLAKAIRKATVTAWRRKKLQALEESLSMYQQSDAIYLQQDASFGKLDTDVQFLIGQLAQGITDVKDLVKREHVAIRNAITQEGARAEAAINSHTDSQVLELRTTAETKRKCETLLQSLKAPRMNQRYNDVMDSRDASFNQVFATYEDMKAMYGGDSDESDHSTSDYESENDDRSEDEDESENNVDTQDDNDPEDDADDGGNTEDTGSESYESSEGSNGPDYMSIMGDMDNIYDSWFSFNSWLKSDDKLFYIQGKPGSGKSTLVKFVLNQDQTRNLVQEWSPDAIIISYFFWKIGSEEQNSIKGLWCSLLYQRLQDQQQLMLSTLQQFRHLSLHSEYHDWSVKDLQAVWDYVVNLDTRHICIFVDGLDEIRDKDGFSELAQSIQLISRLPRIKLCVSTRPEAQIMRWLKTTSAEGILLEQLTRFDMLDFVRKRLSGPSSAIHLCWGHHEFLSQGLVAKAQGVFLWLHLATRSIIEGIENHDSEDMLLTRLHELPGDLEKLYVDMWERLNAKSSVYRETARQYFRYVMHGSHARIRCGPREAWRIVSLPSILQITCAENTEIQQSLLTSTGTIGVTEILGMCNNTKASIHNRSGGLLEVHPLEPGPFVRQWLGSNDITLRDISGNVAFIHRTAHDFLTDTEAGQDILGCGKLPDFTSQSRLLKGLICSVVFLTSELDLVCGTEEIMRQITDYAQAWGTAGVQLATEMLDIIRPLRNKKLLRNDLRSWAPQRPFLSYLANKEIFEDYVISCLTTETSSHLATTIMREGWYPLSEINLSKRMFNALINLGADPHEYDVLLSSWNSEPIVRKGTAFTNFLTGFILTQESTLSGERQTPQSLNERLHRETVRETLKMAMSMARTCQDLETPVALFASFSETGTMRVVIPGVILGAYRNSTYNFVVFEVNVQFLLLSLLSKIGGDLAQDILADAQAEDVLSKLDRPSVKIRYFKLSELTEDYSENVGNHILAPLIQRIVSSESSLPRNDIERLFDVDFTSPQEDLRMRNEDRTDLEIITEYVKDLKTEQVNIEGVVTDLAAENLEFCTFEKAGIIPSLDHFRKLRENGHGSEFPLSMRQLEAAAARKEATGCQE
ncbi:uncharacterized protein FTJAE_4102 [Fusarium tjaetaba]|uniref:NACHT domain-containing protein n=1 Tax=Fusarium tjaetaba TaxID=1567544 RepID=A0A8H5W0S3_9HYPO|nr:uncharacterized protein FTJAE_4102 [Fusarium tjaetaba]KAF5641450.1 hypothetical protein FTJAE_4102 [Fusarium tjaetaba]